MRELISDWTFLECIYIFNISFSKNKKQFINLWGFKIELILLVSFVKIRLLDFVDLKIDSSNNLLISVVTDRNFSNKCKHFFYYPYTINMRIDCYLSQQIEYKSCSCLFKWNLTIGQPNLKVLTKISIAKVR